MDAIDKLKASAGELKSSVSTLKETADRTQAGVASANDKIGVAVDILNRRKDDPELLQLAADLDAAKQTLTEEAGELASQSAALEQAAQALDKASEETEVSGGSAND
jgi:predicted  nucleic acid-binding Zn-ribbon protein